MARPIKFSKAVKIMAADIERKIVTIENAAKIAVNKTLDVTNTFASHELEDLTGYHQKKIKGKSKTVRAKVTGNFVVGRLIYSHNGRLGALSLRGTKVIKGSGPVKALSRSKQGRKKTKGRAGYIIYNILGKKIKRKGIVIKGRGNNKLAASNMKVSGGKFRRIEGPKGARTVKSGKNKGKSYQTGKLFKLTGPSVTDAFDSSDFQLGTQAFIDEKLNEYIIIEFQKKGIFKK